MLLKIKHLLQRFNCAKREMKNNVCEFGITVAFWKFWDALFPPGKSKGYINALSRYMCRELSGVTQKHFFGKTNEYAAKDNIFGGKVPVWIFWWQGEETMPELVRACVNRTKKMLSHDETRICIVTKANFRKYVDIPEYILEKLHLETMSIQAFSDVLRYALMCKYGGVWIDATVYLSFPVSQENLKKAYFTQRFSGWEKCPKEAARGKWCNFYFMGKADNKLFAYVYDALLYWWKHHDKIVDYVIVDYIIWTAYCGIPQIKKLIDAVPVNNENIWALTKCMNAPYTEESAQVFNSNSFFKLSHKAKLLRRTSDGEETVYAKILKENGVI